MEKISAENLMKKIRELDVEQTVFVDFPMDKCNKLELLSFQIQSAEKLFQSFMKNTIVEAQNMNFKIFIEVYTDLVKEKEMLFRDETIKLLGIEVYNFCNIPRNRIRYFSK